MGTKIAVGFANTLQTHRNFSVHKLLLVSPIRCEESFIKGEVLRRLRTYSSQTTFENNIQTCRNSLRERGYPAAIVRKYPSEVKFADTKTDP